MAVDVALLTVVPGGRGGGQLSVLVHRRTTGYGRGRWSLPGSFVHEQERLEQAALRALRDKVGVAGEQPQQLRVFDDPGRDDRGWVLSVAHVDLVPYVRLAPIVSDSCQLVPVDGRPPAAVVQGERGGLLFDHDQIVVEAVHWARRAYTEHPDPMRLLDDEFTIHELRLVHEAVLDSGDLPKDTFRRQMEALVEPTGTKRTGTVGKPASLFRRADPSQTRRRPQPSGHRVPEHDNERT